MILKWVELFLVVQGVSSWLLIAEFKVKEPQLFSLGEDARDARASKNAKDKEDDDI